MPSARSGTMGKGWILALLLASSVSGPITVAKCTPALTRLATVEVSGIDAVAIPVKFHGSDAWMGLSTASPFSVLLSGAVAKFGLTAKDLEHAPRINYDGIP